MKTPSMTTMYEAVRFLAALHPNAVYIPPNGSSGCFYTRGSVKDGPKGSGCIVGQALRFLGHHSLSFASFRDSLGTVCPVRVILRGENQNLLAWLQTVQGMQDAGLTWGAAVKEADIKLRYLV